MKKMFTVTLLLTLIFTAAMNYSGAAYAAADKIGTVDLSGVFDQYLKTKDFDKSLEAKGAQKQIERDKMVNEVKKLRDESELLSAKAKDEKQAMIDDKIKTLQDFDRNTRDALRKERDVMVRDILKEIEAVIQNFGKSQDYGFIFNDRVLVFKSETTDLTGQIIKVLNDSYAAKKK